MASTGASAATRSASGAMRGVIAAVALAALAACASGPPAPTSRPIATSIPGAASDQSGAPAALVSRRPAKPGLTPPFMFGRPVARIGLALPFSNRNLALEAEGLANAAELALFEHGDETTLLMPRDEGADGAGAESVARAFVRDGADVIVGPLLAPAVRGVGPVAQRANVPVIGFSTDRTVAGDGVYLLNFPLESEIARLVAYASRRGVRSFALLGPDDEYGRRVEAALRREAIAAAGQVRGVRLYARTDTAAEAAAQALALDVRANGAQAVLIADGGSRLRTAAAVLQRGGVDLRRVRLLGTSEWVGPDLAREPALEGGWYAAPDPGARAVFERRYQEAYGRAPSRYASLAYDAFALAATLTKSPEGVTRAQIERPDGFVGVDGPFRFRRDGSVERALAVLEVRAGGAVVEDPAPKGFPAVTPAT